MSTDDGHGLVIGSKSLQELSTKKAVKELMRDPNPKTAFFALDEFLQRLIFTQFCAEFKRLLKAEEKVKQWEARCPAVDRQLWSRRWDPIWNPIWEEDLYDDNGPRLREYTQEEKAANGHSIGDKMRKEWKLLERTEKSRKHTRYKHPEEQWTQYELGRVSPDSPLQIWQYDRQHLKDPQRGYYPSFHRIISAQLLLYRLVSVFDLFPTAAGMGRESVDSTESCWGFTLVRNGDARSQIRFRDRGGPPKVHFGGTKESSILALELVNYIISDNVPLAEGTLAGTLASW